MKKLLVFCLAIGALNAQSLLEYKEPYQDTLFSMIDSLHQRKIDAAKERTEAIRDSYPERERKKLYASVEGLDIPVSPDIFDTHFHFPPENQGRTGTCWAFAGVSLIESDLKRRQNKEIRISVMYVVRMEYLEKARYFIRQRGESSFGRGSQLNAVFTIADTYGLVPESRYHGNLTKYGHDNKALYEELKRYLDFIKDNDYWDEKTALASVRAILDKHLGNSPETFIYKGKLYTPVTFYRDVLQFESNDYMAVQSTQRFPFHTYCDFPYPDNWRHEENFYNLPLDEFYHAIVSAVKNGYPVAIGGDTSEPGYNRYQDVAFVPEADIPPGRIDQDVREYRIYNGSTGDDHGVHIVGYKSINGKDWFLIKDSSRNAYTGNFPGYYFYRGDYIRLKMLTAAVPRKFVEK
ncbi:MAG: C1 family peptidase [Fidelibacterota bacterium]